MKILSKEAVLLEQPDDRRQAIIRSPMWVRVRFAKWCDD